MIVVVFVVVVVFLT